MRADHILQILRCEREERMSRHRGCNGAVNRDSVVAVSPCEIERGDSRRSKECRIPIPKYCRCSSTRRLLLGCRPRVLWFVRRYG
jgi:hypothetical protein